MSFRTRLTLFFVLIVIVPMAALGVVVSRLVDDSENGKSSARAGAHLLAARTLYERSADRALRAAGVVAADQALAAALTRSGTNTAAARARTLMRQLGLTRLVIVSASGSSPLLDLGSRDAIAAGTARIRASGREVETSIVTARDYVDAVRAPGIGAVVKRDGTTLASTLPSAVTDDLPPSGRGDRNDWITGSFRAADFGGARDTITVGADAGSSGDAVSRGRRLALALLGGFLVIALLGALLISRQLQAQIGRFLAAARGVGSGDFSSRVPAEGDDEFAALGHEFNKMSSELEERIGDLDRERGRLRDSIQRVGETFASNLDRRALLALGTETAMEAVEADGGRAVTDDGETVQVGDAVALAPALEAAESRARACGAPCEATVGEVVAYAAPLPRAREDTEPHGILAVARRDRPFDDEERTLLGSLIAQTGISLENVELHDQVARQAVTDELTGLFNHRRFQEVMTAEVAAAHRYGRPLGLVMVDIDNFKSVNDTYGHQQGDLVLKAVALILQETSREIDEPARYGGEEMAVALPQTGLEGAYTTAERVRSAVEALVVPRLDGDGIVRVTVSCGVAASATADKDQLVAAADQALYVAKRTGKNRTERARDPAAAPVEAE